MSDQEDPLTYPPNYLRMARAVAKGNFSDDVLLAVLMRSLFDADRLRLDDKAWGEGRMALVAAQVSFLELLARLSGMEVKTTTRFSEVHIPEGPSSTTEPPYSTVDIPVFGGVAWTN